MALHHLFHVAASYSGDLALTVAEDVPDSKLTGTGYVFDLRQKVQIRKFPVRYDRAGEVAMSHSGTVGFVGCYEVHGLAAYDLKTGAEVWRRKDMKALTAVNVSEAQDKVFCTSDDGPAQILEVTSGKTVEKLRGVRGLYPSQFDQSVIVVAKTIELHSPLGCKLASHKPVNERGFQAAFSRSEYVLNEPDCLRSYDLQSQKLLWSHSLAGTGGGALWFCEPRNVFLARIDANSLMVFEARTGKVLPPVKLAASTGLGYHFCRRGTELLGGNLQLLSTETGGLIADLATPELLAWDPQARMDRFKELATSDRSAEELEHYMLAEGFAKNDIQRVLLMKYSHDRKR